MIETGDVRLDHKYIVFKKADVAELAPAAQAQLNRLLTAHDYVRELRGAKPLEAVVIERDWPEYEPTVQSVLSRSTATVETSVSPFVGTFIGIVVVSGLWALFRWALG